MARREPRGNVRLVVVVVVVMALVATLGYLANRHDSGVQNLICKVHASLGPDEDIGVTGC